MSGRGARHLDAVAVQINTLHVEFLGAAKRTLELGIKIGGLLALKKEGLGHGEWGPWMKANLQFAETSARNYMRLWNHRAELKSARVAELTDAYRILAGPRSPGTALATRASRPVDPEELLMREIRPRIEKMNLAHRIRIAARIVAGR